MYDLSSADFWVVASMGLVVGLFVGWMITALLKRRTEGGKNARELRKEMEDYREEVNEHFARTAELFKESTEKYKDLYEHLAVGAQALATDLPDRTQVEFRPGKLLADGRDDDHVVAPDPATEEATAQPGL